MPLRSKIMAISAMWIAVAISVMTTQILWLQITLVALAIIGTGFIGLRR